MTATTTLTMVDGVRVVVPDSLALITPYVLTEQQDWFEDEIRFLRRLLQPGQKIIDIGANHGVYALSMARTVGPTGRVWAFEPASDTARLLAAGVASNGYTHVVLERSALSDHVGSAELSLNTNSELNSLVSNGSAAGDRETVPLTTLDECRARFGWTDIDFLKIDAEGEESRILIGGERFLSELSPLVEYEVKAGTDFHLELVAAFARRGYDSYRLVPGLDLLVRFDPSEAPDPYLLNLFACKRDRARKLAEQGHLLDPDEPLSSTEQAGAMSAVPGKGVEPAARWREFLGDRPYAMGLASLWDQTVLAGDSDDVVEALRLHALSRDRSRSTADRYAALLGSFELLRAASQREPAYLRLSSLARVALDGGARSVAVAALQQLCGAILQQGRLDPREPFLPPTARFDAFPPGPALGDWVLAAVLEELERVSTFSSFYAGDSSRQRLEYIAQLGFGSAEMRRRLQLVQAKFGPTGGAVESQG